MCLQIIVNVSCIFTVSVIQVLSHLSQGPAAQITSERFDNLRCNIQCVFLEYTDVTDAKIVKDIMHEVTERDITPSFVIVFLG
jgi:hypothetical protein